MTREQQVAALKAITDGIVEAVAEAGEQGAPGGVLYLALMSVGMSLAQFEAVMEVLVRLGKVRRSGQLYFAVPAKKALAS